MIAHAMVSVWLASVVATAAPAAKPVDGQSKLTFTQDGKDLVVSTTLEVVDAPHVLWTHAEIVRHMDPHLEGPRHPPELGFVELYYKIIQTRDDPAQRHYRKKVQVKWRLADHKKADVPYRVIERFVPSGAELKELGPRLIRLGQETERRMRGPLFIP